MAQKNKILTTNQEDFLNIISQEKYICDNFNDLLMKAKAKFDWHIDPIQLGSRFFQAKELKDIPRMIKKIDSQKWREFFVKEAKKLKEKILK